MFLISGTFDPANEQQKNHTGGYTLVEMAMSLTILSLVLVGIMTGYKLYMRDITTSKQNLTQIETQAAISRFMFMRGRLPCPADASLARTDPRYGFENCTVPLKEVDGVTNVPSGGGCNQPAGGLCNTNTATTNIRRGMLPFSTLEIPEEKAYDAYGMRLTYMVSMGQTVAGSYVQSGGKIDVRDITTIGGAERSLIKPDGSADFFIFSSGPNKVGAFPRQSPTIITGDGRIRMTAVPAPCTVDATGGKGEFTNCTLTTDVVYAGEKSTRFIRHADSVAEWNVSWFLDDATLYSAFNSVGQWRLSDANARDMVLINPLGTVGVDSVSTEKLDLGLIATAPSEAALRVSDKLINNYGGFFPGNGLFGTNGKGFYPSDISGNASLVAPPPGTPSGKLLCYNFMDFHENLLEGITANGIGSALSPLCKEPFGQICPDGTQLKGFADTGFTTSNVPLCTTPTEDTCSEMPVQVCYDTPDEQIAYYTNLSLSYKSVPPPVDDQAWLNSPIVADYPWQMLPAGVTGNVVTVDTNTVQLYNSDKSCSTLWTDGLISTKSKVKLNFLIGGVSAPFAGHRLCRFGFNGGKRVDTYTCSGGVWTRTGQTGDCAVACVPTPYPAQDLACNTLSWTNGGRPAKVLLADPAKPEGRSALETQTAWTDIAHADAGTSCGGALPPVDVSTCDCTNGPIVKEETVTCSSGTIVDGAIVPAPDIVDTTHFKHRTTFTCSADTTTGTWSQWNVLASVGCKCNEGAVQDTAYTCKEGDVPGGTPPKYTQTLTCPSTWLPPAPGAPSGDCVCTPKANVVDPGASYKVLCSASDIKSGWVSRPNDFGWVTVTAKYNQTCNRPITASAIPTDEYVFYGGAGAMLLGAKDYTYTNDGGAHCYPMNGTWTTLGGALGVTRDSSPMKGGKCISAADHAACVGGGGVDCPAADAPRQCFEAMGGGWYTKYNCQCI